MINDSFIKVTLDFKSYKNFKAVYLRVKKWREII